MNDCPSCEKILELINDLIDGKLEGESLEEAERLIRENPQCSTMFRTVSQTINLYRMRRDELENYTVPEIDWDALNEQIQENSEND